MEAEKTWRQKTNWEVIKNIIKDNGDLSKGYGSGTGDEGIME